GLKKAHQDLLLKDHLELVYRFRKTFSYFERARSKRGPYKVADGINRDAIFCMRDILRELPQIYLTRGEKISHAEFMEIIRSSYALKADLKLNDVRRQQIDRFQESYAALIDAIVNGLNLNKNQFMLELTMRSSVINKYERVTGDSITYIVQKVMKCRPKLGAEEIYRLADQFAAYQ